MPNPMPEAVKNITVLDASADAETIAKSVDFIFCGGYEQRRNQSFGRKICKA